MEEKVDIDDSDGEEEVDIDAPIDEEEVVIGDAVVDDATVVDDDEIFDADKNVVDVNILEPLTDAVEKIDETDV